MDRVEKTHSSLREHSISLLYCGELGLAKAERIYEIRVSVVTMSNEEPDGV